MATALTENAVSVNLIARRREKVVSGTKILPALA